MKNVFTYGSLMFPEIWDSLVGGHYLSASAVLFGFRRYAVRGAPYPVIMPGDEADRLDGMLYYGISPRDQARLDEFEGEYYRRRSLQVLVEGEPVAAQVYELKPRYYHIALPRPWDEEHFRRVGLQRFRRMMRGS